MNWFDRFIGILVIICAFVFVIGLVVIGIASGIQAVKIEDACREAGYHAGYEGNLTHASCYNWEDQPWNKETGKFQDSKKVYYLVEIEIK